MPKLSSTNVSLSETVMATSIVGGAALGVALGIAYAYDWMHAAAGSVVGVLVGSAISLSFVGVCEWAQRGVAAFTGRRSPGLLGLALVTVATFAFELLKLTAPAATMVLLMGWVWHVKEGVSPFF